MTDDHVVLDEYRIVAKMIGSREDGGIEVRSLMFSLEHFCSRGQVGWERVAGKIDPGDWAALNDPTTTMETLKRLAGKAMLHEIGATNALSRN